MSTLVWSEVSSRITLPEKVTLHTLPSILSQNKKSLRWPVMVVDFVHVSSMDSVALALLLSWSANIDARIKVENFPTALQGLVTLYDLDAVIEFV